MAALIKKKKENDVNKEHGFLNRWIRWEGRLIKGKNATGVYENPGLTAIEEFKHS